MTQLRVPLVILLFCLFILTPHSSPAALGIPSRSTLTAICKSSFGKGKFSTVNLWRTDKTGVALYQLNADISIIKDAPTLYYRRLPSELTIEEAATIIALTQAPSSTNNLEGLVRLRDMLIEKYVEINYRNAPRNTLQKMKKRRG
ncbi:MAG: transglycosylase domain-containing protein [Deltaproteobacteria bacterium]|nr:transglycosylase domain-containing protein [Deltaproteobacteria bacterium]